MLKQSFSTVPLYWLVVLGALSLSSSPAHGHVVLDEPDGGETIVVGSVYTIEWHIHIAHTLLNWDLWYSTTGASGPWITMAMDLPAGSQSVGSTHTYDWTVPDDLSNQVRVRVRMDNSGMDYEDISNADFTIVTAPVPTVSEGSLIVTALLAIIAGTFILSQRRIGPTY